MLLFCAKGVFIDENEPLVEKYTYCRVLGVNFASQYKTKFFYYGKQKCVPLVDGLFSAYTYS